MLYSYIATIKPLISGSPISGHLPQLVKYNLTNIYKKLKYSNNAVTITVIKHTLLVN